MIISIKNIDVPVCETEYSCYDVSTYIAQGIMCKCMIQIVEFV